MTEPQIKILLIEDNLGDARLFREMLNEAQNDTLNLVHFERLSEGIEYLEKEKVDVVLLDQTLPDSEGLKTFETVNTRFSEVPIVLLTGLDNEEVAIQAVKRGAQEYLVKGHVAGDSLIRAIRYSIERNQMLVELKKYAEKLEVSEAQVREQRDVYAKEVTRITERFESRVQELSVIRKIGESLKYTQDTQSVFKVVIEAILEETNAENCSLDVVRSKNGRIKSQNCSQTDRPYWTLLLPSG